MILAISRRPPLIPPSPPSPPLLTSLAAAVWEELFQLLFAKGLGKVKEPA